MGRGTFFPPGMSLHLPKEVQKGIIIFYIQKTHFNYVLTPNLQSKNAPSGLWPYLCYDSHYCQVVNVFLNLVRAPPKGAQDS